MTVFELLIDMDMTTRSTTQSWGLFSTREKAEQFRDALEIPDYAYVLIQERTVE